MGKLAYRRIASLVFPQGSIVEIGSERGEGSTAFLAELAQKRGVQFFSVDIEEEAYQRAKKIENVHAYHRTGEEFFHNFPSDFIALAYLDGYDWLYSNMSPDIVSLQISIYAKMGLELTSQKAQVSNLKQMMGLSFHTIKGSLIVIDDTWYDIEHWNGKGALAIGWATNNGFKLIEFAEDPDNGGYIILRKERT